MKKRNEKGKEYTEGNLYLMENIYLVRDME